jgi:hypothetical protein
MARGSPCLMREPIEHGMKNMARGCTSLHTNYMKYVPFSMCNVQFENCNMNNQLLKILHDFLKRFDDYLMIL